jgi:hypothetical protein
VIARNSSFAFKGRAVDIKEVGRRLGVRYVLEGSVRKASRKVRITGQLIDAVTGAHIWADRFERDLTDIFPWSACGTSRRYSLNLLWASPDKNARDSVRLQRNYRSAAQSHLSLNKDSPVTRPVETVGRILPVQILGGLHHQYVRS